MARRGRNARRVRRDRNTDNSLFSDKQAREICETKQNLFYSVRFFLSPTSLGRTLQIWIFFENVNVDVNLQKSIYSSYALYKYLWSIYTSLCPTLYNTEKEMINKRVMCPAKVNQEEFCYLKLKERVLLSDHLSQIFGTCTHRYDESV